MFVDPEAVKPFEVTDEQAEEWLKQQLADVGRQIKAGLRDALLGPPPEKAEAGTAPRPEGDKESPPASATPGLDLLAAITGTPREALTGDYGAIGRAVQAYFKDMATTAGDAVSGDAERMAAAQARMQHWGETLRAHGIAAPEASKAAEDHASAPPENTPAPPPPPCPEANSVAERLRGLAEAFRRRADAIAAARKAAAQAKSPDNDEGNPQS